MLLGLGALVLGGIIWLNSLFSSPELPEHYDFHNDDISAARRQAAPQLEAELEALERRAAIVPVGAAGRSDECRPGNEGYKAPSQYASSCRMELVRLFPIGEPSKVEASRLAEALIEGDCPPRLAAPLISGSL